MTPLFREILLGKLRETSVGFIDGTDTKYLPNNTLTYPKKRKYPKGVNFDVKSSGQPDFNDEEK